ncbi:biotin/lipoyl-containing protein [Roseibium sediminis]|uniref:biotin/lipoyl-containing protein n=1 Tax=Roseibium sediminis TaxID=1775174 RepID=UPI00123D2B8E|nr:biotin/lipoyl-containing protein [Roseibium sediminis]
MPHDVIMPALGMAQETGLIVSWLKNVGDPVKVGDPLIEVETDKATMEVEAQADGFLVDVQAAAGEAVPVGELIARISKTAENSAQAPQESTHPASAEPLDGHQVIMPALGMAQETGLIISWAKQPGDAVSEDDVLLEVETDKSAMEVPAGASGFLAGIFADAGTEVPVGDMIALITAEKPSSPLAKASKSQTSATKAAHEKPVVTSSATSKASPPKPSTPVQSSGKILASPKLKRLAQEQGLDLALLTREGLPQPFHVSDLETLKQLALRPTSAQGTTTQSRRVTAKVAADNFDGFLGWLAAETGAAVRAETVFALFAAGSLRPHMPQCDQIIATEAFGIRRHYQNPDLVRLSGVAPGEDIENVTCLIRDLTRSPVTEVQLGAETVPVLSIARQDAHITITLESSGDALSAEAALSLISGFAERVQNPLRHLL